MTSTITITPIPSFEDMRPLGNGLFEVTGTVNLGSDYDQGSVAFTLQAFGLVKWATWHFEPLLNGAEPLQIIPDFSGLVLECYQMSDGAEEGDNTDLSGLDFPFRITGYVT